MLKVTITEKGGTERVLFFEDEDEVSIGRLQTNRVTLSKPNVSKRHAVLTVRDGRVLVEDLGSTNGTYVNGRRIMATREVGPQDRIYIGDFTIRARPVSSREEKSEPEIVVETPLPAEEQRRSTVAMPAPFRPGPGAAAEALAAAPGAEPDAGPSPAPPPLPPPEELSETEVLPVDLDIEVVSEEAGAPAEVAPVTELVPEVGSPGASAAMAGGLQGPASSEEEATDFTPIGVPPGPTEAPSLTRRLAETAVASEAETDQYMVLLKTVADRAGGEVFESVPADQSQFSDEEWQALSDRVLALVDLMRRENALPATMDAFQVTQDLLFDFAGLGPLEELLQDQAVRRILIDGPDRVCVTRGGKTTRVRRTFAGSVALDRVAAKLLGLAGLTPDSMTPAVEGRLPDGTHMMVLRPPLVSDHVVIVLNRPAGSLLNAPDLVRAGVMSEGVFETIERAIQDRRNVVICGAPNTGKLTFLNAVAHLLPAEARVVVIERGREVALPQGEAIRLSKDFLSCSERPGGLCLVSRLFPDAVIVADLDAEDARLVTALGLTGQKGVLASLTATSANLCLHRLEMLVAFGNPTVDGATVRSFVRHFVDLVVVLGLDQDGRACVTEVATLEDGEPRRIA